MDTNEQEKLEAMDASGAEYSTMLAKVIIKYRPHLAEEDVQGAISEFMRTFGVLIEHIDPMRDPGDLGRTVRVAALLCFSSLLAANIEYIGKLDPERLAIIDDLVGATAHHFSDAKLASLKVVP